MATEISVFDSDEFEQLVANRDLRISKALVETILKNLNGRKRHFKFHLQRDDFGSRNLR
jgi:hypothetical protein